MNQSNSSATIDPQSTVAHKNHIDWYIWGSYFVLILVSVVELFSASSQEVKVDDIYGPIIRHGMFLAMGLAIMLLVQRIHFK